MVFIPASSTQEDCVLSSVFILWLSNMRPWGWGRHLYNSDLESRGIHHCGSLLSFWHRDLENQQGVRGWHARAILSRVLIVLPVEMAKSVGR